MKEPSFIRPNGEVIAFSRAPTYMLKTVHEIEAVHSLDHDFHFRYARILLRERSEQVQH